MQTHPVSLLRNGAFALFATFLVFVSTVITPHIAQAESVRWQTNSGYTQPTNSRPVSVRYQHRQEVQQQRRIVVNAYQQQPEYQGQRRRILPYATPTQPAAAYSPSTVKKKKAVRTAARSTAKPTRSGGYKIAPKYRRQIVNYNGKHAPGTIIVNTNERLLYHVKPGGKAVRYGIGVARPGFEWAGTHRVTRKKKWPSWTPPASMRKREPNLPKFMPGGPSNPMGARALYLGSTLYRIHGSNAPWTIGQNVSSGCIRMLNEDVSHLYQSVPVGAKVIVI